MLISNENLILTIFKVPPISLLDQMKAQYYVIYNIVTHLNATLQACEKEFTCLTLELYHHHSKIFPLLRYSLLKLT